MSDRCPGSTFLGRADLPDYKLIFDGYSSKWKGAGANIVEIRGEMVSGGLFEISEANLITLDRYEGFPKSYNRKELNVLTNGDQPLKAIVYYGTNRKSGLPSQEYMDVILQGAEDCSLSGEYTNQLKKIKTVSI